MKKNDDLLRWEYEAYKGRQKRQRKWSGYEMALPFAMAGLILFVLYLTSCKHSTPAPVVVPDKKPPVQFAVKSLEDVIPELAEEPEEPAVPVETVIAESTPPTKYYDVPLDNEKQDLLRAACEESGIEMELALAVIWKETDFRNIKGDGGNSYGYMQIQPRWHADRMERLGVTDLMDPAGNFRVGCDFLAELLEDHALAYALTAYNSGKARVSPYSEKVMGYMEVLYD